MPGDKDVFGSQGVFSLDKGLGEYLSVMANLSIHIVDQEWLSEVVFVVREWHSLKVKSHGSSALNITEFVHTSGSVGISVEELSSLSSVLWEVWVGSSLIPFLIIIDYVVGLWAEEGSKLLVSENLIENINFINSWLSTFVSNS